MSKAVAFGDWQLVNDITAEQGVAFDFDYDEDFGVLRNYEIYLARKNELKRKVDIGALGKLEQVGGLQQVQRLQQLSRCTSVNDCDVECGSMFDADVVNSIVYIDPPYIGTLGYSTAFDYDNFINLAKRLSQNNYVFVSEYTKTFDEQNMVAAFNAHATMGASCGHVNFAKQEKLFEVVGDYSKEKGVMQHQ